MVQWLRTSDVAVLGAHAAFVGSTPTEIEIFIWIMSPVWSKKTSVAATDERNIIILHRKYYAFTFAVFIKSTTLRTKKNVPHNCSFPLPHGTVGWSVV